MNDSFSDVLLGKIMCNRYVPKSQVERQLSPIIEVFLESAMQKLADEGIIWDGQYRLLATEFPIHNQYPLGEGDRSSYSSSTNIDFLVIDTSNRKIILVELKTDYQSMDKEQLNRYREMIKSDCPNKGKQLYEFLDILKSKNSKYFQYINSINEIENDCHCKLSDLYDLRLLYIAPKNMNIPQYDNIKLVSFSDFYDNNYISHPFKEDWEIVTKYIKQLDDKQNYIDCSKPVNNTLNQYSQSVIVPPDVKYKSLIELIGNVNNGTLNDGYVGFLGGPNLFSSELKDNRDYIVYNRPYKWKKVLANNDKGSNWIPIRKFLDICEPYILNA